MSDNSIFPKAADIPEARKDEIISILIGEIIDSYYGNMPPSLLQMMGDTGITRQEIEAYLDVDWEDEEEVEAERKAELAKRYSRGHAYDLTELIRLLGNERELDQILQENSGAMEALAKH